MTDREKLVELINKGVEIHTDGYQRNIAASETIADHLIANGVTVQQWISVEDRLPDVEKETNALRITQTVQATDGEETFFGHFMLFNYDGSWMFVCVNEDVEFCTTDEITHWMPLPEPQKGESHADAT